MIGTRGIGRLVSRPGAQPVLRPIVLRPFWHWQRAWPALLLTATCLGFLTAFVVSSIDTRERNLESAKDSTANLARSLADHAEATLRLGELTTSAIVERVEQDGVGRSDMARLHEYMAGLLRTAGRLQDAMVFDAQGRFVVGAKAAYADASGLTESLDWHRDNVFTTIHVSAPSKNWVADGWSLLLSRRLDAADGTFAGVAVVAIDLDVFATAYHALNIGKEGAIALTSARGQLLVRTRVGGALVGQDVRNSPFFRAYANDGPVGVLNGTSPLDGIRRQGTYRAVANYPLVVFVGLSVSDILNDWWHDTVINGIVVGLLVLCTALLGRRLGRLVRSHRRAAAAAQASERLYRLLAMNGTDVIVQLGTDLRRRYVSPASEAVLGYTPDMLIGRSPLDDIHPDDREMLAGTFAELRGTDEPRSVSVRFRRADGAYIWIEASIRALREENGYVVSVRDVSARVAVQAKLHEANSRLERLVMLDGLTGIANRRRLDRCLEREFRRASREEQPLALLMIDADRFKSFNDTYGHQAGDECLKAIAGAVQGTMRRAADLAARFGGEEFCVMLPHTDEAGAAALAEMVRAAVEALAIPHVEAPLGIMTISVGVGVAHPGRNAETVAALMAAADGALYAAKHDGRNCVKHSGPLRQMAVPVQLEPMVELDF